MSTLKIWETVRGDLDKPLIRLDERASDAQTLTFTTSNIQSAAFAYTTGVITVRADVACAIRIGANPVATVNSYPLEANVLYDFEVQPGQKLAVIS